MEPNLKTYFESWSQEFLAKANRVRALIGSSHWLSEGHHKEALVRNFLASYLPANYLIGRGFVRASANGWNVSNEQDILVIDPTHSPPLFNESDLLICGAGPVIASLEIKTEFNKAKSEDAAKNLSRLSELIRSENPDRSLWTGAFFYRLGCLEQNVQSVIEQTLKSVMCWTARPGCDRPAQMAPTCIAVLDAFVAFMTDTGNEMTYKIFKSKGLTASFMFSDLLRHLPGAGQLISNNELDQMCKSLDEPTPISGVVTYEEAKDGS